MKLRVITWNIEIYPDVGDVAAASLIRTRSEEFQSFETSMIEMLEAKDYFLNGDVAKHDSRDGLSYYYEFIKFTETLPLKLAVFIRISGHKAPDRNMHGKVVPAKQLRSKYLNTIRIPQLMEEFNSDEIPISVPVNIIFDNNHFMTYFDAIQYINNLINRTLP